MLPYVTRLHLVRSIDIVIIIPELPQEPHHEHPSQTLSGNRSQNPSQASCSVTVAGTVASHRLTLNPSPFPVLPLPSACLSTLDT